MSPSARRTAPVGVRGRSREKRRADGARDLRQFRGGRARVLEIARGQQDLDSRGKRSGAGCANARVEQSTRGSTRPRRRSAPAPDEAATGRAVAFVRARSPACTRLQPSRTRPAGDGSRRRGRTPRQPPAGTPAAHTLLRILCGIIPLAPQLHDFGAIEQALAAVAHQAGLRGTPCCERRGPLVRAAQIEGLLTRLEDAAVDIAGQDWRDVACDHRGHRFVEQRNAVCEFPRRMSARPRRDTRARPDHDRQTVERSRPPARTWRGLPRDRPARCVEWRRESADIRARRSRGALRRGYVRLWRTSRTQARWRRAAAVQTPARRRIERPLRGRLDRGMSDARASEGLALVIASDEVGCRRKSFEVFGFKGCFTVGGFQQAIRFRPRLLRESVPGSPERLDVCHVASLRIAGWLFAERWDSNPR